MKVPCLLFVISMLFLSFASCFDGCTCENYNGTTKDIDKKVTPNKSIHLSYNSSDTTVLTYAGVTDGNKTVFEYHDFTIRLDGCEKSVCEDCYRVLFELDPNINEFNFKNKELSEISLAIEFFKNADHNLYTIDNGTFISSKIPENGWHIILNVTAPNGEKISMDKNFFY